MKITESTCFLLAILMISGCVSSAAKRPDEPKPKYRLVITDNIIKKQFELKFVSMDERDICLSLTQWPSSSGWLDTGSKIAKLSSGRVVIPAMDRTFGYSAGQGYILKSGNSLAGYIPYSEFGDVGYVASLPDRRLDFIVVPWLCGKASGIKVTSAMQ